MKIVKKGEVSWKWAVELKNRQWGSGMSVGSQEDVQPFKGGWQYVATCPNAWWKSKKGNTTRKWAASVRNRCGHSKMWSEARGRLKVGDNTSKGISKRRVVMFWQCDGGWRPCVVVKIWYIRATGNGQGCRNAGCRSYRKESECFTT